MVKRPQLPLKGFTRCPVLLVIDNFQALYCKSSYKDSIFHDQMLSPFYAPIAPGVCQGEEIVRAFYLCSSVTSALTYQISGARGCSRSDFWGKQLKLSDGTASLYIKRSPEPVSYAEGSTNIPVPEFLGVSGTASLFDVRMKDKAISRGAHRLFCL